MRVIACALLSLLVTCPVHAEWISSFYSSNNEFRGNMFDLKNIGSKPLELTGAFKGNFATGNPGAVSVWYRPGTWVGHSQEISGWTQFGSPAAISSPVTDTATPFNVGEHSTLRIDPGQTIGMFVYYDSGAGDYGGLRYTNWWYPHSYGDSNLEFSVGIGKGPDFSAGSNPPVLGDDNGDTGVNGRLWNGSIEYMDATPEPGTLVLMGLACPLAAALRRRRRPKAGMAGR